MTERERPMDDVQLDALLGQWLHEGPDSGPDRIAEKAMLDVATSPQDGARLVYLWTAMTQAPLAWAAAVVAVMAIGIGLYIGFGLVGEEPSPSPSPSTSPTPAPSELTLFVSEEDGYQILIPAAWEEVESGFPDARKWVGETGQLMISYGTPVFEGGAVTYCAPPGATCGSLEISYSIPYAAEYTMDSLRYSLEGALDQCNGACPLTSVETTLGLEPAGQHRLVVTDRQLTYAYAIHNYRPVIVYVNEPVASADEAIVQRIRDSFEFVDPPSATEPPNPAALVRYENGELGFAVSVPGLWEERPFLGFEAYPGVVTFGEAVDWDHSALTISVGDADGQIVLCDGTTCATFTATTLDELQEVVVSAPNAVEMPEAPMTESQLPTTLGGEPGFIESVDTGGYAWAAPTFYSVFAIHDGRPVVLSFDHWSIVLDRISIDGIAEIVESFRFLD